MATLRQRVLKILESKTTTEFNNYYKNITACGMKVKDMSDEDLNDLIEYQMYALQRARYQIDEDFDLQEKTGYHNPMTRRFDSEGSG